MPLFRLTHYHDRPYFVVEAADGNAALDGVLADPTIYAGAKASHFTVAQMGRHDTVGRTFRGPTGNRYLCTSYDSRAGFWMQNTDDAADRRNVSERAIGRTYHEVYTATEETT